MKTRLQLSRADAERLHVSSLADTLETALRVVDAAVLFLYGGEDADAVVELRQRLEAAGLDPRLWQRIQPWAQRGVDLGERLESAFEMLAHAHNESDDRNAPGPGLVIGADSPSLDADMLRRGLQLLRIPVREAAKSQASRGRMSLDTSTADEPGRPRGFEGAPAAADIVLGPTADGGYWAIGLRRPLAGLLQGIAWSTARALTDTIDRARTRGLRIRLLDSWTDVDRPEDLHTLARQIATLRARGDGATARHTEGVLRDLGILQRME